MKKYIKCSKNRTQLSVQYYKYERYGGNDLLHKARVSGDNLLDALCKMVDHMGLYIDSEYIIEEGYTPEQVLESIGQSNGDGCDYIVSIVDDTTGETLFSDYYDPELDIEDWDD